MSIHPSWVAYTKWLASYQNAGVITPTDNSVNHQLVYVSAPYSRLKNQQSFMQVLMRFTGRYMMAYPGQHLVTPLFNHYSLDAVPGMARDYAFWGDYSRNLLKRCDRMIVLMVPGWDESTGVADEIETAEERGIPIEYISAEELRQRVGLNQDAEHHVYEAKPIAAPTPTAN